MSIGAHEYTVTAVWRTWTATSTAKSVTVAYGPATHLVLEAANTTPTAGATDNLTITAKDASGDTVGTYSGSHSLIFEGANEAAGEEPLVVDNSGVERSFGEATEITFSEGKSTVSSAINGVMTLYKAEAAHIKVKEGSLNNSTGLAVTVKAAAAKKLSVPTPSEQEAGAPFNVTLTATDEYGNTATSYAGKKTITWSEPANSPSGKAPSYTASVTFTAGAGAAASTKLYDAQTTTLKAKESTTAIEGTSGSFTVKPAVAKKFTVPTPSEQEAGAPFNVTLTALDEYSNTATSYAGAKTLAWSGPASSPSPISTAPEYPASATTVTFTAGVGTASSLKLYDAASTTLKAKEGSIEGASGSFTVKAAAANSFSMTTPAEATAGTTAVSVKATAIDEWGNTAKSYTGAKTLTWSGPSNSPSGQPPSYPATVTFASGVGTASTIKLYDAQNTTLKATEGTIEGVTGSFTVKAAATKKLTVPTPSEQEAGAPFNITLTATDEWGNITAGYAGSRTLAFSEPASSPGGLAPEYPTTATTVTFTEGVGTASLIKLFDAQNTTLKVKEGSHRDRHVGLVHDQGWRAGTLCLVRRHGERRQTRSRHLPLCLHHDQHRRQQEIQSPRQRHRRIRQHRLQPRRRPQGEGRKDERRRHAHERYRPRDPRLRPRRILRRLRIHEPRVRHERSHPEAQGRRRHLLHRSRSAREVLRRSSSPGYAIPGLPSPATQSRVFPPRLRNPGSFVSRPIPLRGLIGRETKDPGLLAWVELERSPKACWQTRTHESLLVIRSASWTSRDSLAGWAGT